MTTFTAILIGAVIAFAIICLVIWGVRKSEKYTRENLGKTKILTNGDRFVLMQYGCLGELIDKWSSYRRSAMIRFFDGECPPDWYYLDNHANIAMSGFGKVESIRYEFPSLEKARYAEQLALKQYDEQKKQHEYDQQTWQEVQ